jgi:hypothetical protein
VFLYRSIKQSGLGAMARVRACTDGRVGVTARCWLRGKHQQEFSATRQYLLLSKCGILRSRPSRADRANKTMATLRLRLTDIWGFVVDVSYRTLKAKWRFNGLCSLYPERTWRNWVDRFTWTPYFHDAYAPVKVHYCGCDVRQSSEC